MTDHTTGCGWSVTSPVNYGSHDRLCEICLVTTYNVSQLRRMVNI